MANYGRLTGDKGGVTHNPMHRFTITLLSLAFLVSACTPEKAADDKERAAMESANNLKNAGNLPEAAKTYEQIARDNPTSVDAEIELAAIDRKLGKSAVAVALMQDAEKRQPDNQKIPPQLGYALIDAGRYEDAIGVFDDIIKRDPNNALAYSGKGVAFDKSGKHLAAQDLYRQALKIAPGSLSIENNLAMSCILGNQLDQAIPILEALAEKNPDNKTIRHNLALAYGLKKETKKADALNRKDLPPDQVKENDKFYDYYVHLRENLKKPTVDAPAIPIGFSEPSAPVAPVQVAPAPENTPLPTAPAKAPTSDEKPTGTPFPTADEATVNSEFSTQHRR